ncbi:MAG: hypothetical protein ACO1SV_12240 [Fimbriimonas sp.]
MTPEERYFANLQRRNFRRLQTIGTRGALTRARIQDARVGAQQLTARSGRQLRITQADVDAGKATEEQIGLFWFVPGYSKVGGPDVIPPD